ncbi:hypothetical protein IAT40_006425 [Kwoniella sp. CBS 6097]
MPPRGHKRPYRQQHGQYQQPYDQQYDDDRLGSGEPFQYQSHLYAAQPQSYASYAHQNAISSSNPSSSSRSLTVQIPPQAYIQAYEAQLVYPSTSRSQGLQAQGGPSRGSGVIRYAGEVEMEVDEDIDGLNQPEGGLKGQEVWADRHDIIHLLPSLTIQNHHTNHSSSKGHQNPPGSPTSSAVSSSSSWDSLPSDIEEKFALSDPEEIEAYETMKKKKWMEALRAERLKEREKEDRALGLSASGWKDDEEPPAAILATMQHTAKAIFASPNPSVLELRILTNHAKDERFEFLKGRYKEAWNKIKKALKDEKDNQRKAEEKKSGLGGLMGGYESSDGEEGDEDEDEDGDGDGDEDALEPTGDAPPPPPPEEEDNGHPLSPPPPPPTEDEFAPPPPPEPLISKTEVISTSSEVDEEEKRRLRRLRAEEWKKARNRDKL